ncbi:MAG: hypothetical protein Q7N50_03580 [Armatimonadota bacterium]|nr:hypothetical protein [Armatimonadota bacterium]
MGNLPDNINIGFFSEQLQSLIVVSSIYIEIDQGIKRIEGIEGVVYRDLSVAEIPIHTRLVSGFPFRYAPFKSETPASKNSYQLSADS